MPISFGYILIPLKALAREVFYEALSTEWNQVERMLDFRFVPTAAEDAIAAVTNAEGFTFQSDEPLSFDFNSTCDSEYNSAVINELITRYEEERDESRIKTCDRFYEYVQDKFESLFKQARQVYKQSRPLRMDNGTFESTNARAERLQSQEEAHLTRSAASTRRHDVSLLMLSTYPAH